MPPHVETDSVASSDSDDLSSRQPSGVRNRAGTKEATKKSLKADDALKEYQANWKPPPFTIKDVKDAIPPHCFERSVPRSMSFVFRDLVYVSILVYAATHIDTTLKNLHWALPYFAWPLYQFALGAVGFGIWILGHECGHQSFSKYTWFNHVMGFILHTSVLVPFFSWKISHAQHHRGNGHMDEDQAFVPDTKSDYIANKGHTLIKSDDGEDEAEEHESALQAAPLYDLISTISMLLFGFPVYLLTHKSGQKYTEFRATSNVWISHYTPASPMFAASAKHRVQVAISTAGILAVLGICFVCGLKFGFFTVAKYYLIPYLWVNFWLVLVTFLQHTDVKVPHFRGKQWNFLTKALSTIDRDFGFFNDIFHEIANTHVLHHIFHTIPHYHAKEATKAIIPVLGQYYLKDDTNVMVSLWLSMRACKYVDDEGDLLWFKSK